MVADGWYDVVVVGGGFGGAFCARELEKLLAQRAERVLLIAPESFLLFSPLLPEAASGTLEPRHAVIPLRSMLGRTEVLTGQVTRVDIEASRVEVLDVNGHAHTVSAKALVLAPGSVPSVLPIPGLKEHAVGFKTLADAIWLRNRVLRQLEAAEAAASREERRKLLTFTFVGGGYAGVEALAELESLVRDALPAYRSLHQEDTRWVLIEAAGTLLPGLDKRLAKYTEKVLRKRRVEVRLSTRMESCIDGVVRLSDTGVAAYESGTIVWTAGQRPHPMATELGLGEGGVERGRIVVDDHLRVPGRAGLFAMGDVAAVPDPAQPKGGTCPGTAQHAMRQGKVAAHNVAAFLGCGQERPFTYKTRGLAVTLGRASGTAQVRKFTFTGPLAWWMGRSYHLLMMPGLGRKSRIVSDWTLSLLFPRDVSQLGTLGTPSPL